jgi:gliding motility-associated-like protein
LPEFNYMKFATVREDGRVALSAYFDNDSDLLEYFILKANHPNLPFDTIHRAFINLNSPFIQYIDPLVLTNTQSYTYKIALLDACKELSSYSNIGRTILLKGEAVPGFRNVLNWNAYEDWNANVEKYIIHRSLDSGATYNPIAEVPASSTTYADQVIDDTEDVLRFCYRIQAIENDGNIYGFKDVSWSNEVCVVQEPTIYIPNAFRPDAGYNSTFKPIGTFNKVLKKYEFLIFNRWGELLFATADADEAWDGTYQKQYVPTGVYVYQVKYISSENQEFVKRGFVVVLD